MAQLELDLEVFAWLGEGLTPRPPAYLRLLGPGGDERGERVLANLEVVAARLRDQPDRWGALIRAANWRPTLIGCSAILLTWDTRFLADLLDRFRQQSWVAPQLAVALGLLHRAEAVAAFEDLVRRPDAATRVKEVFSAYAVLRLLGSPAAGEFEATDLWQRAQSDCKEAWPVDYVAQIATKKVPQLWDYWSRRGPR